MSRAIKWLSAIGLSLAGTGMASADDNFSVRDLMSGSTVTKSACASESVWVVVQSKGDCIRYYSAGLARTNPIAIVFFHGDLIDRSMRPNSGYQNDSPEKESRNAQRWSALLGAPYIFLARPGTNGSSGDHKERRRAREVLLVDAALSAIKDRYGIGNFIIAGQSSGGHLVGAMLAMRGDISCAVASSGVTAVRVRTQLKHWSADATGYRDYWDPADHVNDIRPQPGMRIFVLGDPADSNVPFESQRYWYNLLKKRSLDATLLIGSAEGAQHHKLSYSSRMIAGWCARGIPTPAIAKMAADLKG